MTLSIRKDHSTAYSLNWQINDVNNNCIEYRPMFYLVYSDEEISYGNL